MKKSYINKEEELICSLQKLPLSNLMRYISKVLDTDIYIFTLLILYFKNCIGYTEIKYIIYGQIFSFSLKFLFSRKRPYNNNSKINNLSNKDEKTYSFPSGHSFSAMMISLILLRKLKNCNVYVSFILKIMPYLIALSRVQLGVHYPSDVFFGLIFAKVYDTFYFK